MIRIILGTLVGAVFAVIAVVALTVMTDTFYVQTLSAMGALIGMAGNFADRKQEAGSSTGVICAGVTGLIVLGVWRYMLENYQGMASAGMGVSTSILVWGGIGVALAWKFGDQDR